MNHRKVPSQGNAPFSWEQKPSVSKFCFRDFQALALQSSPARSPVDDKRDYSQFDVDVSSKIPPPPPCRSIRSNAASAKGIMRGEEDPFLVAYKECTKSGKNGKFVQRGSKGVAAGVKKTKLFGFSCKSVDSCEVIDDTFFKLRSDRIRVSTLK